MSNHKSLLFKVQNFGVMGRNLLPKPNQKKKEKKKCQRYLYVEIKRPHEWLDKVTLILAFSTL